MSFTLTSPAWSGIGFGRGRSVVLMGAGSGLRLAIARAAMESCALAECSASRTAWLSSSQQASRSQTASRSITDAGDHRASTPRTLRPSRKLRTMPTGMTLRLAHADICGPRQTLVGAKTTGLATACNAGAMPQLAID